MMLSSSCTKLFPLHLTLLNFTDDTRIRNIQSGNAVLACRSCAIFNENADFDAANGAYHKHIEQVGLITFLHECIGLSFQSIEL